MGHALDHTLMDALTRRKRMQGFEVLWLPGMDHAGIATQTLVERQLGPTGRPRTISAASSSSSKVWEWKQRVRRHDRRPDAPPRRRRRLEPRAVHHGRGSVPGGPDHLQAALRRRADLPGRADRQLVPALQTAISDIEVEYEDDRRRTGLDPVRLVDDAEPHIVVATTRVETMLGDTAVAVHPDDARYAHLVGADAAAAAHRTAGSRSSPTRTSTPSSAPARSRSLPRTTPTTSRSGSGTTCRCRRSWTTRGRITDTGTASTGWTGSRPGPRSARRCASRAASSPRSGRTCTASATAERSGDTDRAAAVACSGGSRSSRWPRPPATPCATATSSIHPPELEPRYFDWVDNMHDWCISRQLWWGHRIPVWYWPDGEVGVRRPGRDPAGEAGRRIPTSSTPGSPRRCGRSRRWAGRTTPPIWRSSIRPAFWSPATTSCSSGSRG